MSSDYGIEFMHEHPWLLFISYGVIAVVIAGIIFARWYSSKAAWPFHPRGSMGFLHDEFLRLGAIFIPYALLMMGVKWFLYDMHPELLHSPYVWVALLSVFIFRRLSRFVPFVRTAGARLDAARKAAREAHAKAA